MKIKDILANKKVLFIGDSITHNWNKYTHNLELTHPEDPNYDYGYSGYVGNIIASVNLKSIHNIAVSGGCYAECSSTVPERPEWRHFTYQVETNQDLIADAEVIFVFFGANDYYEQSPFGRFDEMPKTYNEAKTFYGGMNYGFNKIKKINPKATIIMIESLPCIVNINKTCNYSIKEYALAERHEANRLGLNWVPTSPYFCDKCWMEKYSDDGVHPNVEGHKRLAEIILNSEI